MTLHLVRLGPLCDKQQNQIIYILIDIVYISLQSERIYLFRQDHVRVAFLASVICEKTEIYGIWRDETQSMWDIPMGNLAVRQSLKTKFYTDTVIFGRIYRGKLYLR